MIGLSRRRLAVGLLVGALGVAACAATEPATSPGMTVPVGEVVVVNEFAFQTPDVNIEVGQTVTWENRDEVEHTATHGTGGEPHGDLMFDFELAPGLQASYTFEEAGNFPVTCLIHPTMQMNVTVVPRP